VRGCCSGTVQYTPSARQSVFLGEGVVQGRPKTRHAHVKLRSQLASLARLARSPAEGKGAPDPVGEAVYVADGWNSDEESCGPGQKEEGNLREEEELHCTGPV